MDVEVLNHFLTVVREENISRAAERLHEEVTQIIDKIRMEFKAGEELSGVVSIGTGGLMSAQILSKRIS